MSNAFYFSTLVTVSVNPASEGAIVLHVRMGTGATPLRVTVRAVIVTPLEPTSQLRTNATQSLVSVFVSKALMGSSATSVHAVIMAMCPSASPVASVSTAGTKLFKS